MYTTSKYSVGKRLYAIILITIVCPFDFPLHAQTPTEIPIAPAPMRDTLEPFVADRMRPARRRSTYQDSIAVQNTPPDPAWAKVPMPEPEQEGEGQWEGEGSGESAASLEQGIATEADTVTIENIEPVKENTQETPEPPSTATPMPAPEGKAHENKKMEGTPQGKGAEKRNVGDRVKNAGNKIRGFVKDTFDGKDKK